MAHLNLWTSRNNDVIENGTVIGFFPADGVNDGSTDSKAKKRAKLAAAAPVMRNVLQELQLLLDLKGGFEVEVDAIRRTIKGL